MRIILFYTLLLAVIFTACQPQNGYKPGLEGGSTTTATTEKVVLDSFADFQILRYEMPGWEKLTIKQKTFIYYLSEATLSGRDIIYDQHFKHNLAIRKTIEAIQNTYTGERSGEEWTAFDTYSKRI